MKVVVTGATGMIGRPLCAALTTAGDTVTALSRDAARAKAILGAQVNSLAWGAQASDEWKQAVSQSDVVIHLAGEAIGGAKWTPEIKAKLRASRVETTRALVDAIGAGKRKPSALLCASAVGYYGDRHDETVTEETLPGTDFLAGLCQAWETEAQKAETFEVRVARMRTGIALGKGGALEKMLHPLPLPINPWKLGLGGPFGSGKQWMPWIHIDDVVGLYLWAATNTAVRGPVNVTAPNPVTNAEFAHAIGRALHRPAILPVPGFAVKLLAGSEFADSLLGGQKALPTVAQKFGYTFRFPDIHSALNSLLESP